MLRIVVCDDEEYYRELIKNILQDYLDEMQIACKIDVYESGKKLCMEGIAIAKYDIIFLDINMEEFDGIETAKRIRRGNTNSYIVFVTAFVSYAVQGYEVEAIRYLLKNNINFVDTIKECLDTIIGKMKYKITKMRIPFVEGEKEILLERIHYIESSKHKVEFYIMESEMKIYTIYKKLNEIEDWLGKHGFLRTHKSFLVNIKHIASINNYKVILTSGQSLPVPKLRYREVKEKYTMYKGEI